MTHPLAGLSYWWVLIMTLVQYFRWVFNDFLIALAEFPLLALQKLFPRSLRCVAIGCLHCIWIPCPRMPSRLSAVVFIRADVPPSWVVLGPTYMCRMFPWNSHGIPIRIPMAGDVWYWNPCCRLWWVGSFYFIDSRAGFVHLHTWLIVHIVQTGLESCPLIWVYFSLNIVL